MNHVNRVQRIFLQPPLIEKLHALMCSESKFDSDGQALQIQCDAMCCKDFIKFMIHVGKCAANDCDVPFCSPLSNILEIWETSGSFECSKSTPAVLEPVDTNNYDVPNTAEDCEDQDAIYYEEIPVQNIASTTASNISNEPLSSRNIPMDNSAWNKGKTGK